MARFSFDHAVDPDEEWEAPGLLLELVLAGCPVTDVGTAELGAMIELRVDGGRLLAITGHEDPPLVELADTVRSVLLPWIR